MTHATVAVSSTRTLAIAGRQLAMLGELAELAMGVSRAFAVSAVASAKAEEAILSEEWFTPEVGRARACGARDAAESFQKASRAVRLTLMLEKKTAEWLDDLESGAPRKVVVETSAVPHPALDRRRPAASPERDWAMDAEVARRESDRDRLVEFDRSDQLLSASFRDTVDAIGADLEATVDWETWRVRPPEVSKRRSPPSLVAGDDFPGRDGSDGGARVTLHDHAFHDNPS